MLSNSRLSNIDLRGVVLEDAQLKNLRWRNVRLFDSKLIDVNISDSDFFGFFSVDNEYERVTFKSESLFPDESSDDSPKPFDRVVINENQLGFVYNPGWIKANQHHYSLSPDLVPPPIVAVTLVSMDDHAKPIHDANNNPCYF